MPMRPTSGSISRIFISASRAPRICTMSFRDLWNRDAEGTTMAKKTKKEKRRASGVRRQERRFISQGSNNPRLVRVLGAASALILGAGAWAYFYAVSFADDEKLKPIPSYLVAGGAVLLGIA